MKSSHIPPYVEPSPTKSPSPPFWTPFGHSVVLLRVHLAIWPLHIHVRVRIAQQYLRSCLNVYPTSLSQIEFLRFQQGLSVTVPIFLVAQDYITEVLDSAGTDFGLKLLSF